jgi:glycosyltransferase involved in cell wall biosynthesis
MVSAHVPEREQHDDRKQRGSLDRVPNGERQFCTRDQRKAHDGNEPGDLGGESGEKGVRPLFRPKRGRTPFIDGTLVGQPHAAGLYRCVRKPQNWRVRKDRPSLVFIVPGRLETRTGGYEYDRRMVVGLRTLGWSVDVRELDRSFPHPTSAALDEAARVLAAIPDRTTVLIDGLALGAMPAEVEREASRLRVVALIHLPLAAEIGIGHDVAARLEASERRAIAGASLVIVTGKATAAALASYGVASHLITVVAPGTDRAPLARGSHDGPLQLLCVATLNPGKGHDILFRALAAVPYDNWHLTCAGSLDRDPPTVQRLREKLRADGLDARVSLVGELDAPALAACYDNADLFVLATLHETYGMAVAEALAHGLPVVSTATGAIPELVGDDAGLLAPPGDTAALTSALSQMLCDRHLRARLAEGARRVRDRLPAWEDAVDKMAAALDGVTRRG